VAGVAATAGDLAAGGWCTPVTWESQGNVVHGLLQRLREDVEQLERLVIDQDLPARVIRAEDHLAEVRERSETQETQLAEAVASVKDLMALVRRMDARVLWLERRIRLSEAAVLELDDVDPEVVRLAAVAESGRVARLALLTSSARDAMLHAVDVFETADATAAAERDRALGAAVRLADTEHPSGPHRSAATEFRAALTAMEVASGEAYRARDAAREARQRLRRDDALRSESEATVEDGERAWATLRVRLRTLVAEAVGTAALLPSWFTTVLGPMPPAEHTDRWMEVATELLAYRITYRIGDPVVALGPEPVGASRQRHDWWAELDRSLRELQR